MQATEERPEIRTDEGDQIRQAIDAALVQGALPGETDGFDDEDRAAAATFVAAAAARRTAGKANVRLESGGGSGAHRLMRLAVINDDMPFLVDSICAALAARGIDIHRVLHPILAVRRDADGVLSQILPNGASGERRESMIYLELERADAKIRREIAEELEAVLADVRAAVSDWGRLQDAMRAAADALPDGEGAALIRWFVDRHFTLLGHQRLDRDGTRKEGLGVLRGDAPALAEPSRQAALAWFENGKDAPLLVKSSRVATVHRRAPLDLVIVPVRENGHIAGLSVHAGLWTSAALRAPSSQVPVLRARLAALEEKNGFDPASHAGKALRHALSALPHDLLIAFSPADLETVALTAMSLADRPRPKLLLVPSPLQRHLFAFVWLPRDEMNTSRRVMIGDLLAKAAGAELSSWAMELGDGDLALIRYTLDLPRNPRLPDAEALDRQIVAMVRGWAPAVEEALAPLVGGSRATRLALSHAGAFPLGYRARYSAEEAALDIARLNQLDGPDARGARLYRHEGDAAGQLRLKIYRTDHLIPLSDAVPVLENFGFRVLEEIPAALDGGRLGYIHDFLVEADADAAGIIARAETAEATIAAVLEGRAENDAFNQLLIETGLAPDEVVLFRAWFRYLRQTGLPYGLGTVVQALRKAPDAAHGILALFRARLDPAQKGKGDIEGPTRTIDEALIAVTAIDDDRILRRLRALVSATLRTNAFSPGAEEALAFKLDSAAVPDLPRPVPWREIWVYSPRVEGIHLRGGPIARGGLRWSDRRDDFRTEILGLMKAQVVKNAVIVPTGAKGGFYPKQLPPPGDRDAWMKEGTEAYRIFIRALLSLTDNIVEDKVVHPVKMVIHDGEDPYFVVAADKGTASFSDVANAIALDRGFWLGDAFASGGSQGYDHKAMGITARGAWISVQRHFAEMGIDVQSEPVRVVGCGDMSGDVFGNGMLLSRSLKVVAAFDHRHIFLDPDPDPAASWAERKRLFDLPRSSWADYDATLISAGGGVFPRSQKAIPISPEVRTLLGIDAAELDPSSLISAILKSPVDLIWFGGIGTYIKAAAESHVEVGDTTNDPHRVNAEQLRARVVGEGANLGVTQAGRIAFALRGGRINTDFIDNSAGVDCSDNEVNIKIPLNREMREQRLSFEDRNALLTAMTDDVAALVLEDNRLQTLALSLAEYGGATALPSQVRVIEALEAAGRIDRTVDGLAPDETLLRRAQDGQGLTRPELAVLLSHAKLALQAAIEASSLPADPALAAILHAAFPPEMLARHRDAIDAHRLRGEIIATKVANKVVNRLGLVAPFELAEEEGVSMAQVASAFLTVAMIFDLDDLWQRIESAPVSENARFALFIEAAKAARLHIADLLRAGAPDALPGALAAQIGPGVRRLDAAAEELLRDEARMEASGVRGVIAESGADQTLIDRIVRLKELDGAIGTALLALKLGVGEVEVTQAYVRLGEALGLDWAKASALRFVSSDPWERLLTAGLARDFEQLRLDFLARIGDGDPLAAVNAWLEEQAPRVDQFVRLIARARTAPVGAAMLAQIGTQARLLLAR
ncbi:NAD-glutamate dehydrogenase [Flavisphingomonas formosensis]|uniref:NAD-glutamate dehydrogenase n=1 Tax=Flavisphingomonas formosensis TaxID=861534 RepID=UPI0012FB6438|nr:NAD-glutamate dehydrogenase domain-containing protein [Sphingomonas formosensis]